MKDDYLTDYYFGKATRTVQGLGLAFLLTILLLLAGCGGGSATGSSQTPTSGGKPAVTSTPTTQVSPDPLSILTLSQAQQQAGYHLLSIPSSLADYTLTKVTASGPSGQRVYRLYYSAGKNTITLIEGPLVINQGSVTKTTVSLRGTTGALFSANGQTELYWTEQKVGRVILGQLSSDQAIALAKALV